MTAKYFAAINIKEKSHEASEYKYNYLHFTPEKPRLRDIYLMVKCIRVAQGVSDRDGKGLSSQAPAEPAITLSAEHRSNLTDESVTGTRTV